MGKARFNRETGIIVFFLLLIMADLVFSFRQYNNSPVDGDFAYIVLGAAPYDKVLTDPLGISALKGETYAAPNRYTAHAVMSGYFRNIPLWLQAFVEPIQSLYISIAITKLLVHIALLILLSYFCCLWARFSWKKFLLIAVLLSPFFNYAGGFTYYMAIIDQAITYVMFYALPMALMLLFYLPFFRYYIIGKLPTSKFFILFWLLFLTVMVFFGPLSAPIFLISSLLILGYGFLKNFFLIYDPDPFKRAWGAFKDIHLALRIIFTSAILLSLYNIGIGTQNIENQWSSLPLEERFALLPKGLYEAFINPSSGLLYLTLAVVVNSILLYVFYRRQNRRWFKLTLFLLFFCGVYIVLLPLGGYRSYRPLIIRRDTILPIVIILLYIWGSSSALILWQLKKWKQFVYLMAIAALLVFYTDKDNISGYSNECEKMMINKLAKAEEPCVLLPRECGVLQWSFNTECSDSQNMAQLLEYYHILPNRTLWHFREEKNIN